jgi:hypothetical protein
LIDIKKYKEKRGRGERRRRLVDSGSVIHPWIPAAGPWQHIKKIQPRSSWNPGCYAEKREEEERRRGRRNRPLFFFFSSSIVRLRTQSLSEQEQRVRGVEEEERRGKEGEKRGKKEGFLNPAGIYSTHV